MKKINILSVLTLLCFFAASCTEEIHRDQIYPSVSSYTFDADGETFALEITAVGESGGEWEYSGGDDSWLTIERTEMGLNLTASANETLEFRETTITLTYGIASADVKISQLSSKFDGSFVELSMNDYGDNIVFSINSKFAAGCPTFEKDNEVWGTPKIVNMETGETTVFESAFNHTGARAISDDGRYVSTIVGSIGCDLYIDGVSTEISLPTGYENPVIEGFSSDGSIWVGYCKVSDGYAYHPVKWLNGEPRILDMPQTDMQGENYFQGTMARGCSADGSIIYGSEFDTRGLCMWDEEGLHFVAEETAVADTTWYEYMGMQIPVPTPHYLQKDADRTGISPNGKYICAQWEGSTAAAYNTETEELVIYSGYQAQGVDNNGNVFGTGAVNIADSPDSHSVGVAEWLQSNYGVIVTGEKYLLRISDDGKRMCGWTKHTNSSNVSAFSGWYYVE